MIESFADTIAQTVGEVSPLAYLLIFLGGVVTSLGPCNLSMVPVIIGYVGGQQNLTRARGFSLSLFFTLGSTITFVILGVVAAGVGGLFGPESAALRYGVAAVCFIIGLHLLGAFKLNLDFLTRLQPKRVIARGYIGAILLGLIVGLVYSALNRPAQTADDKPRPVVVTSPMKSAPATTENMDTPAGYEFFGHGPARTSADYAKEQQEKKQDKQ